MYDILQAIKAKDLSPAIEYLPLAPSFTLFWGGLF